MSEVLRWGDLERPIEALEELLNDPKTVRPFAQRLRDRAKAHIASEGGGTWPPFAESTLKKRQRTGTSAITKHGQIRAAEIRRIEGQIGKLQKKAQQGGWGAQERKKLARLQRRLEYLVKLKARPEEAAKKASSKTEAIRARMKDLAEKLRAAHAQPDRPGLAVRRQKMLARLLKLKQQRDQAEKAEQAAAHATTYEGRDVGKRVSETRKMMPRMGGTLRASVRRTGRGELTVIVYSKAGEVGLSHHEGLGRTRRREIIPEPTEEDLDFLVDLLERQAVEAIEEG